jgi:hypothetical protein
VPLAEAVSDLPSAMVHAVTVALQPLPQRRPDAATFAELLYSACPPTPVRFPIGLVLGDAEIAAMVGRVGGAPAPGAGDLVSMTASQPREPRPDVPPFGDLADVSAGIPVGSTDVSDDDDDDEPSRRPLLLAGGGAALLLGGAVAGGLAWAHLAPPAAPTVAQLDASGYERTSSPSRPAMTATPTPTPATPSASAAASPSSTVEPTEPAPTDLPESARAQARWRHILTELDNRRARAFAETDPSLLGSVYVGGSDLLAADRAEIDKCVRAGCRVEGLRFEIKELDVASETAREAVLVVTDQLQAYTIVSPSGVRTDHPAGPWTTRRITLVHEPAVGWLIARIDAA